MKAITIKDLLCRFILLALVTIAQLSISASVIIKVFGIDGVTTNSASSFKAFIHSAPTSALSQSNAKIEQVIAQYPKDKTNMDVKHLYFWDTETKYLPFDIFHHFPRVELIDVGRAFQEMASPGDIQFKNFLIPKHF